MRLQSSILPLITVCLAALLPCAALASSHSEAPGMVRDRSGDVTDLYAFVSPDAPKTTTIVGNWVPLLEPNAGPNFYLLDTGARFYFNIDNVGDNVDHIRYEFEFRTTIRNGNTFLHNTGPVTDLSDPTLNLLQTYTVTRYDDGVATVLGRDLVVAPANVGAASMPDYDRLVAQATYRLEDGSTVFVGPRDDPFFVDLGAIFDLLTIRRLPGDRGRGRDGVAGFNVMTVALQVPHARLTRDGSAPGSGNSILGLYASTERQTMHTLQDDGSVSGSGAWRQSSRLGMPLVNEVVIPLSKKDLFNVTPPAGDGQFLPFVTTSEVAGLFNALYGIAVPPSPRNDLVTVFLTGVPGLNQPANVVASERLRLNMAIPPTKKPLRMGVLAGDLQGFPNGRRLQDDVVDIAERVVAGVLVSGFDMAPNNRLGDGVDYNDRPFLPAFPYVAPPFSGLDSPHARRLRGNPRGDGPAPDDHLTAEDHSFGSEPFEAEETMAPVGSEVPGAPSRTTSLEALSRNPGAFHRLRFSVAAPSRVAVRIHDLAGRQVRTLVDQEAAAGTFDAHWDGMTEDGLAAGRGVYFARLSAGGRTLVSRKIVLE